MKRINIDSDVCLVCDLEFKTGIPKTKHHALPKFLDPKNQVIVPLCKECHEKLNSSYVHQNPQKEIEQQTKDWEQFKQKYGQLRERFKAKTIDRGQFGEGLWDNLVKYLEGIEKRLEVKK